MIGLSRTGERCIQIHQLAKLSGVTVRTLHYYDQIGLLSPEKITESGYRLYGNQNLRQLQQILFFRELGFALKDIQAIMSSPGYNMREALTKHRELLLKKRERLDRLITHLDATIQNEEGDYIMDFKAFDINDIETAKREYAEEAKARWGNTDAYAESQRKTDGYNQDDWKAISNAGNEIFQAFADNRGKAADSPEMQLLVQRWQDHISQHFYQCSDEILAGLGEMYTADERFLKNIDRYGASTAALMSKAIAVYCHKQKQ